MHLDVPFFRGLIDVTASTFTDGTFAKWDDTAKRLVGASPVTTGLANLEALASLGIIVQTATDTWAARTIVGVTDRTAVTFGNGVGGNPVVDIAATYAGQSSITTLGTITTGVWQGTVLAVGFGGTGLTATPANGQLQIGNGSGDSLAGLTGTSNQVVVTPGAGSITLSLPQSIHTAATPTFATLTLSNAPTADNHAATKAYVDGVSQGLDSKASVRVATTANITLSGAQTIDGVSVVAGDRVLVKNQSTGSQNGLYVAASGAWSRAADADTSAEVTTGLYVFVSEGTVNASSGWVLTTPDPITLGTTALTFTQFSGAGQITAGNGLNKTGNTLSVVAASGGGLSVSGSGVAIDTAWTGQAAITTLGTITSGQWQGAVIGHLYGGSGISATPANGEVLIGNGAGWTKALLTVGSGMSMAVGAGSITLSASTSPNQLINGNFEVWQRGQLSAPATITGNTTNGNASVTGVSSVANLSVGMTLTGTGLPSPAIVHSIQSASQFLLTANATATGTGVTMTLCTVNNRMFGCDRWRYLAQSGQVLPGLGALSSGRLALTAGNAGGGRHGMCQWLEAARSKDLRGRQVTFQISAAAATAKTIRVAILEWTGTENAIGSTRDPVNDWTSGLYSSGNFFSSMVNVVATGSQASVTTATTVSCTGTIGASANNVCVMVWVDDTTPTATFAKAELFEGGAARSPLPVDEAANLAACERFFFKTFALGQQPKVNVGNQQGVEQIWPASSSRGGNTTRFRGRLHRVPTVTVYNPLDFETGSVRDFTNSTNPPATLGTPTDHAVTVEITSSVADGSRCTYHLVAEAEIE